MNIYAKFYPVAVKVLSIFGEEATLTRTGIAAAPLPASKFDRSLRTEPITPIVTMTRAALVKPEHLSNDQGVKRFDTMAVMLHEPVMGDKLTIGGASLTIGEVDCFMPQGLPIIYFAEAL